MVQQNKEKSSKNAIAQKKLRLWPGIIAAILLLIFKFIIPRIVPDSLAIAMFGGLLFGLIILVWWAFFSRAKGLDRLGVILLMIIAIILTRFFLHQSIAEAGMGLLFPILAMPFLTLAFVLCVVITSRLKLKIQRISIIIVVLLACSAWTLIRTGGINNDGASDFFWRWTKSPEEQMLDQIENEMMGQLATIGTNIKEADWPGFRGRNRDSIIHGIKIETDWTTSPPVELWHRPVGPGWSSFAVSGDLFFTQEQRGEDEVVSCYNIKTGKTVWLHKDATRFWESNAGAGPRGTPTLVNGRLYALGATGILNVLNAGDGSAIWARNVAEDTETKVPIWGFSSSPLVLEDMVIVAAAGSIIGYDLASGEPIWKKSAEGDCYSSPHLFDIDGVKQILLQNVKGVLSVLPTDGTLLWEHEWSGYPIVQPAMTSDGDLLISVDERSGIRRIAVTQTDDEWTIEERWTSDRVKPYFNDSVIHKGFIYGFDGRSLACMDIENGERKWKGGRYGRGQFILLADQDLLLVISEKGKLALVKAIPDEFTELVQVPAIKGKTWNHPVLVDDILLVRNAAEMAAFQLSLVK